VGNSKTAVGVDVAARKIGNARDYTKGEAGAGEDTEMIRVGVIGYGYWGPNLVRNFADSRNAEFVAVSDLRPERLASLNKRYPMAHTTTNHQDLLRDNNVDAIAIATPISTHFPLAMEALRAGKHVLVEKPLAASSEEAALLIEEAERRRLVLMVDHTFVYTGAVRKIQDLVSTGTLGEIYYYDSVRVNLGLFQNDVNVIWDLAVHDLSILDNVIPQRPSAVSATGASHVPGGTENIAYLTIFFDSSLIAHIHVNWLAPVKLRRTLIGGSRKMIVYDDLELSEKVKVYDKGVTVTNHLSEEKINEIRVGYRTGDMIAPRVDVTEALQTELEHFVRCIEGSEYPITDGIAGLRIVQILEAATRSMRNQGRPVRLEAAGVSASPLTQVDCLHDDSISP
jgi:predicted dehydrogenase